MMKCCSGENDKDMCLENDMVLVQDDKYILKKEREEDKQAYFELYKEDSILFKRMPYDMFRDFFEKQWENRRQEKNLYVSIFKKQDFAYLGNIVLQNIDSTTPELGIDVVKKYQRKGVAYDTLKMFVRWGSEIFNNMEYFLVRIYSDNLASLSLFQKLGVTKIGEEPSEYQVFLNQFKEHLGKEEYGKVKKKNPDMENIAKGRYIVRYKLEYKTDEQALFSKQNWLVIAEFE